MQPTFSNWESGKILNLEKHQPNFILTTQQGQFLIHELTESPQPVDEGQLIQDLSNIFGPLTPLTYFLRSNTSVRSVHQNDRYYLVYSLSS